MNKNEIVEVISMLDLTSATAKPLVNRLESALGKEGSASTRLSMAGSSLLALADKVAEDESGLVYFLGSFLKVVAEIARDNKAEKVTTASHTPRENWHDADSAEGRAILAKTAPKAKKASKKASTPTLTPELLEALTALLNA